MAAKGRDGRARVTKDIGESDMDAVTQGIGAAVPLIERRLGLGSLFREDDFRCLVIQGLHEVGVDAARVKLEYPHPANSRKGQRTDAVILDANGMPKTAIEFKCHRKSPNPNSDTPHAENAGELLADFAKLRDFPNVHRYVMYLTDGEMFRYFNNPNNGLNQLLSPFEQEISDRNLPRTKTLRRHAGDWSVPARTRVKCVWDLGSNHWLVVWQVLS